MEIYSSSRQNSFLDTPNKYRLVSSNSLSSLRENSFIEDPIFTGYKESLEDTLVTGHRFTSKKNDIRPYCTRKKIQNFIEDLRRDQIMKHKNALTQDLIDGLEGHTVLYKTENLVMDTEYGNECLEKGGKSQVPSIIIRTSTDSKINTTASSIREKPLMELLEELGLECYYNNFKSVGVRSLSMLLEQVKRNSEHVLRTNFSIFKIGHRKRILLALEDIKGTLKREGLFKFSKVKGGVNYRYSYQQENSQDAARNMNYSCVTAESNFPSLRDWLRKLDLLKCENNFKNAGFDDFEEILMIMTTKYALNDMEMKNHMEITDPDLRRQILMRLFQDADNAAQAGLNSKTTSIIIPNKKCECIIF